MVKRIGSFLMVILLLTSFIATALAVEIRPFYVGANGLSISLSISGNGIATSKGNVSVQSKKYKASLTVRLQRDNGSWQTITSWSASGGAGDTIAAGGSKQVGPGSYRTQATAVIRNASTNAIVETISGESGVRSI